MSLHCFKLHTAILRITGEDAFTYLQGQCSADLRESTLTDALWLNRKGRVLAHTVISRYANNSTLLLSSHANSEELTALITANLIADDVTVSDESSRWQKWVLWGGPPENPDALIFPTMRYGIPAWDVLTPLATPPPGQLANALELETLRIAKGIPCVPQDCGANEFPQECGLDAWVSYSKGCYLGQEVMARIHSMGTLRRILRRVTGALNPNELLHSVEGKVAGSIRSTIGDVGLALVSIEYPEGSTLQSSNGPVYIGQPALMPPRIGP